MQSASQLEKTVYDEIAKQNTNEVQITSEPIHIHLQHKVRTNLEAMTGVTALFLGIYTASISDSFLSYKTRVEKKRLSTELLTCNTSFIILCVITAFCNNKARTNQFF